MQQERGGALDSADPGEGAEPLQTQVRDISVKMKYCTLKQIYTIDLQL